MAAEAPPAPVGFNIDGDSFEFCGGSGVETVGEENQSLLGHIVKSLVRYRDALAFPIVSALALLCTFPDPKWPDPRLFFYPYMLTRYTYMEYRVMGMQVDGADISKILIPSFFLEPRSLLEKYSVRDGINPCLPPKCSRVVLCISNRYRAFSFRFCARSHSDVMRRFFTVQDLLAHPHLFTAISKAKTDVQRMLAVVRWFVVTYYDCNRSSIDFSSSS